MWYTFAAVLLLVLRVIPAVFWYLLVRSYNRESRNKLPALMYGLFYLVPLAHYLLSRNFIYAVQQVRLTSRNSHPIPLFKTYLIKMAAPYFFLSSIGYMIGLS